MIKRGKGLRAIWLGGRVEENHRGGVGRTGRRRKWWEGERELGIEEFSADLGRDRGDQMGGGGRSEAKKVRSGDRGWKRLG